MRDLYIFCQVESVSILMLACIDFPCEIVCSINSYSCITLAAVWRNPISIGHNPPGHERIPYAQLKKNWRGWERNHYWDRHEMHHEAKDFRKAEKEHRKDEKKEAKMERKAEKGRLKEERKEARREHNGHERY